MRLAVSSSRWTASNSASPRNTVPMTPYASAVTKINTPIGSTFTTGRQRAAEILMNDESQQRQTGPGNDGRREQPVHLPAIEPHIRGLNDETEEHERTIQAHEDIWPRREESATMATTAYTVMSCHRRRMDCLHPGPSSASKNNPPG